MLDAGEADDKIIGVLENDPYYSQVQELDELRDVVVERIRHYFLTYKQVPGDEGRVAIAENYGREHALRVIEAAMEDYEESFGS
jgi:inorganic pyrophosphatase